MQPSAAPASTRSTAIAAGVIAVAAFAAYHNSFGGLFVMDDVPGIVKNATIRSLAGSLVPPLNSTPSGRPFLNFTLALNYAAGGLDVRGYHILNLLIHVLAGLTLFGILRRTFQFAGTGACAVSLALAAALLWTVHPLQTESVTYVVQRAESLMGLLYLLSLYCFIRGAAAGNSGSWLAAAVLACLLGGATKEVAVSAPLVILLYDRAFLAGSFREALRLRWKAYAGLACTWVELAIFAQTTQSRYGTSGFGVGVNAWDYLLTQFPAIVGYLRLSAWPHPLVFDYGAEWVKNPWTVLPQAVLVGALVAGTILALRKWPALGCAGVCFFAVLAPTSLIPGNRQTMAEHRMYLALAPVAALAVWGAWRVWGRRSVLFFLALAAGFGWLTCRRNEVYASGITLWTDTLAKRPANPYAHDNLADALLEAGRAPEAIAHYEEALRLKPGYAVAENDLGYALVVSNRAPEAILHLSEALRQAPENAQILYNLGIAFSKVGRRAEAIACFEHVVRLEPGLADAWLDLGVTLGGAGRLGEAIECIERSLRLKPDSAEAYFNLGVSLAMSHRETEAIVCYEDAVRLRPDYMEAHHNLAVCLAHVGKRDEAAIHFQQAERLRNAGAQAAIRRN